ncbi:endonuclease/exonuclease/phosphatase family protein [Streptomyces meridianus]|uniref:Endonuclease/exonuclease/phosphatase family protein n=1 Tax=Streptomyces meridianus TaxID=2938945 RepID=A0ABT0XA10_9ACTN|nr:endonuclease/exonuclease/phosphatase family protein [Streptomyces meridianus]MCM2579368.1 endonuclease/exonuclease/phosphatase family protein [Streptomyces meridianus]
MTQAYMTQTRQGGSDARSGSRTRLRFRSPHGGGPWRRGIILVLAAVLLTLTLVLHADIPNSVGNLGSLVETFLPWLGLAVPLLLVLGLLRRSAAALVALLLPTAAWLNLFGGQLDSKSGTGGDLTVATHNVNAENPDPAGTARDVAAGGTDVVALEELTEKATPVYRKALAGTYRYHTVQGTVGVWSKYPLSATRPVDIRLGWTRALRTTVSTPQGPVAVIAAHLPSVRVEVKAGFTAGQRDGSADALGRAIADEKLERVVLLGDLNGTMNDRALAGVTSQMRSAQGAAGDGFGFTWPAAFPMARIDQIMARGVEPVRSWTLPETGSDHLPIAAAVDL